MGPNRQKSPERREEIARAARKLIVEKGMEGLRTRDVAAEVGINISTLHYHIPTKHALIELVAQSMLDDISGYWQEHSDETSSPLELFIQTLSLHWEFNQNYPDMQLLFPALIAMSQRDPKVFQTMAAMRSEWHDQLINLLNQGKDAGVFRENLDCNSYVLIISSTIMNFWRIPDFNKEKFDCICNELVRSVLKEQTGKNDVYIKS